MTTTRHPYFKDMSDDELRSTYRTYQDALYNASNFAQHVNNRRNRRTLAGHAGYWLRGMEIIEGVARQRKISLRITKEVVA